MRICYSEILKGVTEYRQHAMLLNSSGLGLVNQKERK